VQLHEPGDASSNGAGAPEQLALPAAEE